MIPADLRLIECKDLYVGQSSLTGESDSTKKNQDTESEAKDITSIVDLDTICFMGTNVVSIERDLERYKSAVENVGLLYIEPDFTGKFAD